MDGGGRGGWRVYPGTRANFFEVEANGVAVAAAIFSLAQNGVQVATYIFFDDILGTGNDLEAAILLIGVDEGEFGANCKGRHHESGCNGGGGVAVPVLVIGVRQRGIRVEVRPHVVLPRGALEEFHQGRVLENFGIDKGLLKRHSHIVAKESPGRELALAFDVAVAERTPGCEDAVDFPPAGGSDSQRRQSR